MTAVSKQAKEAESAKMEDASYDLMQDIHLRTLELSFPITWTWIKGHQAVTSESPPEVLP